MHIKPWQRGDPIGYINPHIPDFTVKPITGASTEALVPDTLDLSEMADLAVRVLTTQTDPLIDHEMYAGLIMRNPPVNIHGWGAVCQMKFLEALPLMRMICGSRMNEDVERTWMEVVLRSTGPDGLLYIPTAGRPWILSYVWELTAEEMANIAGSNQILCPIYNGRMMSSMILYYLRDGEELWKDAALRIVDGLADICVDRGDYAYYSPNATFCIKGSTKDNSLDNPLMGAEVRQITHSLIHVYRVTGYEKALTLARKLLNNVVYRVKYFGEDGSFKYEEHFHQHTAVLQSLLEYCMVSGETCFNDLIQKAYDYGKQKGEPAIGYFPEFLTGEIYRTSELCEVADMIALSLKMTEAGFGDFLDDADKWARNMFAEGQLTKVKADKLKKYCAELPVSPVDPVIEDDTNAIDSNIGAFAGWPRPNDWWAGDHPFGIQHCCTGNAARAIYYLWENVVSYREGLLKVNLLLNHVSHWARIDSHIPYKGLVEIYMKCDAGLAVRLPDWAEIGKAVVSLNGKIMPAEIDGRYLCLVDLREGDVICVCIDIPERTEVVWIEKHRYSVDIKGNDVVSIDPPGTICPMFLREHYRQDQTRFKKVMQFTADERVYW